MILFILFIKLPEISGKITGNIDIYDNRLKNLTCTGRTIICLQLHQISWQYFN